MAGLYAVIGPNNLNRIQAAAQRLTFFSEEHTEVIVDQGLAIAWVSHDDPSLFGPAYHPETGVRIITSGRIAWDEPDWQRAEGLNQYSGGLSNRLILDQYLTGGVAAIERHNGSAALLVWDPRQQLLHLFTDHFGFHPLFLYRPQVVEGCVISTFPDAIADDEAVETTPDYVSMAEFLWQWKATPPHTYYNEIKYAGPATHCSWDLGQKIYQQREYWQPFQEECFSSLSVAVKELAAAVSRSIYIRTLPRLGPTVSYTSGGLDSRVVLFAAADPNYLVGVNLYDIPNQEAAVAQQLCQTAGVKYVGFAREQDYYPRWMCLGVKYSGATWSLEDNHFLGTRELIVHQLEARTVLSACLVDDLFKGCNLDWSSIGLWGRDLPWTRFRPERAEGFRKYYSNPQPPAFKTLMHQRLQEWFAGTPVHLRTDNDHLHVEDKRVRPVCYGPGLSGPVMFRIFPYDAFLADRAVADCHSRIPAQWKLNATLWGLVVAQICDNSVVDANYGWKPGASKLDRLMVRARNRLRRIFKLTPTNQHQGPATDGSWPNLGWYICNSPTLQQMWETVPTGDRQLITDLWGSNPWQVPLEQWAESPYDFFRLATLINYWAVRREVKH